MVTGDHASAVRARLHRMVCQSQQWSPDCQRPGGAHERETWPMPKVRALIDDGTGARLHALTCDADLDPVTACPDPAAHAAVLYAAVVGVLTW